MTADKSTILESYHTHAERYKSGWCGRIWHPAHIDADGKPTPNTSWSIDIEGTPTLQACQHTAWRMARNKYAMLHDKIHDNQPAKRCDKIESVETQKDQPKEVLSDVGIT